MSSSKVPRHPIDRAQQPLPYVLRKDFNSQTRAFPCACSSPGNRDMQVHVQIGSKPQETIFQNCCVNNRGQGQVQYLQPDLPIIEDLWRLIVVTRGAQPNRPALVSVYIYAVRTSLKYKAALQSRERRIFESAHADRVSTKNYINSSFPLVFNFLLSFLWCHQVAPKRELNKEAGRRPSLGLVVEGASNSSSRLFLHDNFIYHTCMHMQT